MRSVRVAIPAARGVYHTLTVGSARVGAMSGRSEICSNEHGGFCFGFRFCFCVYCLGEVEEQAGPEILGEDEEGFGSDSPRPAPLLE